PGDDEVVLVASGSPADEHEVAIVNADSTTPVGAGSIGEIWVSSPSVARGYWGRPQETTTMFGARLAGSEKTWLRTGDLGALRDGMLVVTGRLKDLVILQGRNYYPHDIELAAERSHPDLRPGFSAAFCVGGERSEELGLALEVSRHHRVADDDALFLAVRSELADTVGVVPSEILLLRQNSIPR